MGQNISRRRVSPPPPPAPQFLLQCVRFQDMRITAAVRPALLILTYDLLQPRLPSCSGTGSQITVMDVLEVKQCNPRHTSHFFTRLPTATTALLWAINSYLKCSLNNILQALGAAVRSERKMCCCILLSSWQMESGVKINHAWIAVTVIVLDL
jgi:hypothetical protein